MKTIGFIGQGWIGKHYADDFEARGHAVVRYALEEPYHRNQEAIATCDIVFIAVPTPTTVEGFSAAAVTDALKNLSPGTTAVIKSTLLPGTTESLQATFPELFVLHSPEFLREASAAHDAAHPERNLIGIPQQSDVYQQKAEAVLAVLPSAPYQKIMPAREAELVKYAGNCFLMTKVVFMNVLYDLAQALEVSYDTLREALAADPRIGASHTNPIHVSGHVANQTPSTQRGAGGHCFIKDFEALRRLSQTHNLNGESVELLNAIVSLNNRLLTETGKDLDILAAVYGEVESPVLSDSVVK